MKPWELTPFLVHGITKDRHPYAVGGFCRAGTVSAAEEAFGAWGKAEFGKITDGYLIDKKLSQMVRRTAGVQVFAAGASIWVAGCGEPAGGVIGRPAEPDSAAGGVREELEEGLWLMAWPGRLGVLVSASEKEAAGLEKRIAYSLCAKPGWDRARALNILEEIKGCSPMWLLAADGCGSRAGGVCAGDRRGNGEYEYWLCRESSEAR